MFAAIRRAFIAVLATYSSPTIAASHEATGGFAFVPPNRAMAPVGAVELAQRWTLSSPTT
jgi:hypothetical protein